MNKTFNVTNINTSFWLIDGIINPTINLIKGLTYKFNINAPGHPFWIKITATTGTIYNYDLGIQNNGIEIGELTFVIPLNSPETSTSSNIASLANPKSVIFNFNSSLVFFISRLLVFKSMVRSELCI